MSTTATTIEIIKTILGEKIEAWADECYESGDIGGTDALELLGIDEDEAIARFGAEIADLLCKVEIEGELESIEVERATRWEPGWSVSQGWISVYFYGDEINRRDFGGCVTVGFSGGKQFIEIASGTFEAEDGLCDGMAWKKAKAA